jgi:hypothetical protein
MGAQSHNGLTMTCTSIGADYYVVRDAADAAYCSIIDKIDWNRILLEASARHHSLTDAGCHPQTRGYNAGRDEMCPDCVRQALLAEDRLIGWVTQGQPTPAEPPADVPGGDWARVLADGVRHRGASGRRYAKRIGEPQQPVQEAVEGVLRRQPGDADQDARVWKAVAAALDAAGVPALTPTRAE